MGKLFSPCKCKGSVRYVHEDCLNRWRFASSNPRSHFECDSCRYRYSIRRTGIARFLNSMLVVELLTMLLLVSALFTTGYLIKAGIWMYAMVHSWEEGPIWTIDVEHWVLGGAGVGLVGFLSVLCMVPGFGVGHILWRLHAGGTIGGGLRAGSETSALVMAGLVVVVFVGLLRSVYLIYCVAKKISECGDFPWACLPTASLID